MFGALKNWISAIVGALTMAILIGRTITLVQGLPHWHFISICCIYVFPAMVLVTGFISERARLLRILFYMAPVYYLITVFVYIFAVSRR